MKGNRAARRSGGATLFPEVPMHARGPFVFAAVASLSALRAQAPPLAPTNNKTIARSGSRLAADAAAETDERTAIVQ